MKPDHPVAPIAPARTESTPEQPSPTHRHSPDEGAGEGQLLLAFLLTAGFMVAEVLGGLFAQSLALLADAGHMMTDSFALALAWIAAHLARRPASPKHSYGFLRAEVLAAWINAILLLVIALSIIWEAAQRLGEPAPVLAGPMLAIASVGLFVNIGVFYVLHRDESGSINIRAARLHVLGDLLGSIGAIAAAGIILLTGWTPADALVSVLIAMLILRAAWAVPRPPPTSSSRAHQPGSIMTLCCAT